LDYNPVQGDFAIERLGRPDHAIAADHACLHDVTICRFNHEGNDPRVREIDISDLIARLRQYLTCPQLNRPKMPGKLRQVASGKDR
jgi:hypothetical protein